MPKYSRFKSKIHPLAYVIGVLLLAIVVAVIVMSIPSEKQKIYNEYYQKQIITEQFSADLVIDKDHLLKSTTVKALESKIDSKDLVIVYIGGNWCPVCVKEVGVYSKELKKNEELLEKAGSILYLQKNADKEISGLKELAEKFKFDEPKLYPTLLSFYNGELIDVKYQVGGEAPIDIRTNVRNYFDDVLLATK